MYNSSDNINTLASYEQDVADKGDLICTKVKRGNFKFNLDNINTFQTAEYLLNKGATDKVEMVLVDKIQDLFEYEKVSLIAAIVPSGVKPIYTPPTFSSAVRDLTGGVTTTSDKTNVEVGTASSFTAFVSLTSRGEIQEPWNANIKQDDYSGLLISVNTKVTRASETYYENGATEYPLNSVNSLSFTTAGLIAVSDIADIGIGYGIHEFIYTAVIAQGPTPVDSNGNLLYDEAYASQQIIFRVDSPRVTIYGTTPIYYGLDGIGATLHSNEVALDFVIDIGSESAAARHQIAISADDISNKGTPVIYSGTTDITSQFGTGNFTKTLASGQDLTYTLYSRTGTVSPSQTTLKITFPTRFIDI